MHFDEAFDNICSLLYWGPTTPPSRFWITTADVSAYDIISEEASHLDDCFSKVIEVSLPAPELPSKYFLEYSALMFDLLLDLRIDFKY